VAEAAELMYRAKLQVLVVQVVAVTLVHLAPTMVVLELQIVVQVVAVLVDLLLVVQEAQVW
jgi:hypothetical protein